MWGCSSPGRAPAWHAGGKGFDPPHLHQEARIRKDAGFFAAQNKQFLLFLLKCLQADAETGMMELYIPDNGLCTRNTEKGANDEKASG